jgi:hypothetical protein
MEKGDNIGIQYACELMRAVEIKMVSKDFNQTFIGGTGNGKYEWSLGIPEPARMA